MKKKNKVKKQRNYRKTEIKERIIKDIIIRDIRTFFEQEDDDYYKPKRIYNIWNDNYIVCESKGNRNLIYH